MQAIIRLFIFILPLQLFSQISALYLSWYDEPSTTMTVQWHTDLNTPESLLYYKAADQSTWQETTSTYHRLPTTSIDVHHVYLSDLTPDWEYEFRIGSDPTVYRFHTMPKTLNHPVSFAVGGDLFSSRKLFHKMALNVASHNPDFIVIGGNIARALNPDLFQLQSSALRHWLSFFSEWKKTFVMNDNRVIPFLIAPGGEDIKPDDYDLFFSLFAFPKKQLYRCMDFGNYLSLFLLDSGHFHPIDGPQAFWLNQALSNHQNTTYRFAVYSDSAYPSFDSYQGYPAKKIRTHWCPLFDRYHLQAAFEHHNHSFKRTFPLFQGQIQKEGTLYLGDGCWGAEPRKTSEHWYLEKKAKHNGVWLVQLSANQASLKAIDRLDHIIDEVSLTSP